MAIQKQCKKLIFTGYLSGANNRCVNSGVFHYWRGEKKHFRFFTRNCESIVILISYQYKMTQYNTLNVKLFNFQLIKLKSGIKNDTEVTLKLSSNVIGDSDYENNFPRKFLLTNTKASKLRKAFVDGSSPNVELSKIQLHKKVQQGFFGRRL